MKHVSEKVPTCNSQQSHTPSKGTLLQERNEFDQPVNFIRKECTRCGRWLSDKKI